MLIPLHWVRVEHEGFIAYGWSDESQQAAHNMAIERARNIKARFERDDELDRYSYGAVNAIREMCVQRMTDTQGHTVAAVTRNAYGAYVLNSQSLMIADVDLPEKKKPAWLSNLRRRKRFEPTVSIDQMLVRLDRLVVLNPQINVRVYRTKAGLRYLFTDQPRSAGDIATIDWLEQLDSDPLYIKLCRAQDCFRARLTPKPWRCGLSAPLLSYAHAQGSVGPGWSDQWDKEYEFKSSVFATCQLLRQFGSGKVDPALAPLVELHDTYTRVKEKLPLA